MLILSLTRNRWCCARKVNTLTGWKRRSVGERK